MPINAPRLQLLFAALAAAGCHLVDPAAPVVTPSATAPVLFVAPNILELTGFLPSEIVSARMSDGARPSISWTSDDTTLVALRPVGEGSVQLVGRRTGQTIVHATAADGTRAAATVLVTMTPPARLAIPPKTVSANGLTVEATTRADSSPAGGPPGAVLYTTTAVIRNLGSRDRTIQLDACSIWLTLHGGGGWELQEMQPLVWDEMRTQKECPESPKQVTLAPGSRYSLSTRVFAHELLAGGVAPNSRYYFHAHVRFDTTQAVVAADSAVISYPTDLVATAANVALARRDTAPTITATATFANAGTLKSHIEYGSCALTLLAYTTSDRSGRATWDSRLRRPWAGSFGYGCTMELRVQDLDPGGTVSFGFESPLIELLGDSLPDGKYYFSANVAFSNRAAITVPAGSLDIALARPPLPAERAADFIVYRASPVTVDPVTGTLHAHATATLTYAGSALVGFSNDCPIVVYAYRDRARRDAAPRSGAPDWVQRSSCGTAESQTTMFRGDSRSLDTSVPARDVLGASLPSGTYYFAVAIRAQGNRVFLSAGEAVLSR